MFFRETRTGDIVRVDDCEALFNPHTDRVWGCDQAGEEEQDPREYCKADLAFVSGECLPRCWMDANFAAWHRQMA